MKNFVISAVAAIGIAGTAHAADMSMPYKAAPAYPVFSWTGCYAGAQVGWGWSRADLSDNAPGSATAILAPNGGTVRFTDGGVQFGGQAGCDYQFASNFVAGIQASAVGSDISATGIEPYFGGQMYGRTKSIADVTGRLGMTWGTALLYAKGGGAWVDNEYQIYNLTTANTSATGWVVGAGIEMPIASNWTGFVEYDYYSFGTKTVAFPAANTFVGSINAGLVDIKQDIAAVKIGANYRFSFGR